MASTSSLLVLLLVSSLHSAQLPIDNHPTHPNELTSQSSQFGVVDWFKSLFGNEEKEANTPAITSTSNLVYDIVYNFLDGLEFHQHISTSQSCFDSSGSLSAKVSLALQEFQQQNYFTAYFNATQSLQHASNVTRHCYLAYEDATNSFSSYIANFNNFGEYLTQVQQEILPNFAPISVAYANLQNSFQDKDWAQVANHAGSIFKTIFHIPPPSLLLAPQTEQEVRLESTPLIENAFTNLINIISGFIFRSGAVQNQNNINDCSNSLIDMNNKWYEINLKLQEEGESVFKEAVFLFADSLTLIHPVSWYCYFVGNGAYSSFSSKIGGQLSYEQFAQNVFFNQLYIHNGYENIKSCVFNSEGIQFDCIGEQLGTVVKYMFFI